jgi:peptidoglycan hydrolase-like protein with peptidoglycan-binding domain
MVIRRLGLVAAAVFLALLVQAPPALAFTAFYPTQNTGNRGVDVQAIQILLGLPADGVFGAGTDSAVRSFQSAHGLVADGIVGSSTWSALLPTVQQGSTGAAVRALQTELNAKARLSLAVDGVFGSGTATAVRNFQGAHGLAADGIVGPNTWRTLIWHYDYPNFGAGALCDQNPDGNGTAANWATAAAIGQLEAAAAAFLATGQGRVPYGDAGFEHGGSIPGHASHQVGLDIDIWPIRTDNAQCTAGRITWQSTTYDRAATRQLVQAVRGKAPGHVKLIFFNDPVLIDEGLTQAFDNHDNHLHVRYCERIHPDSSYDC